MDSVVGSSGLDSATRQLFHTNAEPRLWRPFPGTESVATSPTGPCTWNLITQYTEASRQSPRSNLVPTQPESMGGCLLALHKLLQCLAFLYGGVIFPSILIYHFRTRCHSEFLLKYDIEDSSLRLWHVPAPLTSQDCPTSSLNR